MDGDRFAKWRKEAGLTQAQAAERFKVKPLTINRWERGRSPIPEHVAAEITREAPKAERPNVAFGRIVPRMTTNPTTGRRENVVTRSGGGYRPPFPLWEQLEIARQLVPSLKRASEVVPVAPQTAVAGEPWLVERYWGRPESPHHSGIKLTRADYEKAYPGHTLMWDGDRAWKEPIARWRAAGPELPEGMARTTAKDFAQRLTGRDVRTGKPAWRLVGPWKGGVIPLGHKVARICRGQTDPVGRPWEKGKVVEE